MSLDWLTDKNGKGPRSFKCSCGSLEGLNLTCDRRDHDNDLGRGERRGRVIKGDVIHIVTMSVLYLHDNYDDDVGILRYLECPT